MSVLQPSDCLSAADALARGDWEGARASFQAELARRETPEALEGLGLTAWWLDLAASVFESRERAYRLYLDRGDKRSAARVAVWLAARTRSPAAGCSERADCSKIIPTRRSGHGSRSGRARCACSRTSIPIARMRSPAKACAWRGPPAASISRCSAAPCRDWRW
jgi:hypothetical protein